MSSPYSKDSIKAHDEAIKNYKDYLAGTITLDEMIARNNRISLKAELNIIKVPPAVQAAVNVFKGSAVQRGCPGDHETDEVPF